MDTLFLNLNVKLFPYCANSFLTNPVLAFLSHLIITMTRPSQPHLEFRTNSSRPLCDKYGSLIILALATFQLIIYIPTIGLK